MAQFTREQLGAYLDDALSDSETARIEQGLRESEALRRQLAELLHERDRGEHSVGAIWRRQRLSCPSRDELGSFLLQALDADMQDYVDFHLNQIGCPFCQANLSDLQSLHQEPAPGVQERRRRFFESSAGYLNTCRKQN